MTDLCRRVVTGVRDVLGFDIGSAHLYDARQRELSPAALVGLPEESREEDLLPITLEDDTLVAALTARTRQPIFAPDIWLTLSGRKK